MPRPQKYWDATPRPPLESDCTAKRPGRYNRAIHKGDELKYLMWLLNAAIFFALFAFALNNQEAVTLRLFFGASWQAPLVLVLLMVLVLGVFMGVAVMLPLWLRAKKARRQHPVMDTDSGADAALMLGPNGPRHGL
jgi:lipopolysaccharide assembly protein A